MLSAIEIYQDCSDQISPNENGQFGYSLFNRYSWKAQLNLLDWLSGDVSGVVPPEPYLTQKNTDWLSPFILPYPTNVINGEIIKPSDYYLYQDMYSLSQDDNCDDDEDAPTIVKTPVTALSNDKFNVRLGTFIRSLKPSVKKPIVKQVGKTFQFAPADLGSVVLEYIRYPKRAFIATQLDTLYNQLVPDIDKTIDFEWDENSRNILVWYIVDAFSNRTRESALKQTNSITGKTTREAKP